MYCILFSFFEILMSGTFFLLSLQDKPFDMDDDVIKATSFEVISTLRDVLKTSSLWRDHVQTYTQACSLHNFHLCRLKSPRRQVSK